ncbi:unnamed protein product [Didymodactylos carnosus]|uniref:Uncharacterized protein n=1 Tax=Didymodactylos carnosus TaxID=1234261 RepID=A0A8S2E204_9BILA|nr:unnamed protein product [Didymodactylos carnosus]CAF3825883.1 unnamed protein product [Didymodactylos carnosus]
MGHFEKAHTYFTFMKQNQGYNVDTIDTIDHHLGHVYKARGDLDLALKQYSTSYRGRARKSNLGNPHIAASWNSIGNVYYLKADYQRATYFYDKALKFFQEMYPKGHVNIARTMINVALVYKAENDYPASLHHLAEALNIYHKLLPEQHPYTALTLGHIAGVQALEILEKCVPIDKLTLATCLMKLGVFYLHEKEIFDVAFKHFTRASKLRSELLSKDHPSIGESLHYIGKVHSRTKNYEEALKYLVQALLLFETKLRPNIEELLEKDMFFLFSEYD